MTKEISEQEAIKDALEKAKKKLWEAFEIIGNAADISSRYYDRVMSYANDVEDLIDSITLDKKRVFE